MKLEDYFKYYIQGSDHYLIPKDVFDELFNEMINWKEEAKELKKQLEEYKLITIDYQELEARNQELKSQLKGTTHCFDEEEHEKLKKQLEELKEEKQEWINLLAMFKNQQKDFIKWLENGIEKVKNTEFLDERIQRAGLIVYNRCLRKYKSIIGVSDEEEN